MQFCLFTRIVKSSVSLNTIGLKQQETVSLLRVPSLLQLTLCPKSSLWRFLRAIFLVLSWQSSSFLLLLCVLLRCFCSFSCALTRVRTYTHTAAIQSIPCPCICSQTPKKLFGPHGLPLPRLACGLISFASAIKRSFNCSFIYLERKAPITPSNFRGVLRLPSAQHNSMNLMQRTISINCSWEMIKV